jgi:hypothetical protein
MSLICSTTFASLGPVFRIAIHASSLCFGDSAAGKVRCVDLTFGFIFSLEFKFFLLNHEIKHGRKTGELEKSLREVERMSAWPR